MDCRKPGHNKATPARQATGGGGGAPGRRKSSSLATQHVGGPCRAVGARPPACLPAGCTAPARPACDRLGHAQELRSLGSRALGANRPTPLPHSRTTTELTCIVTGSWARRETRNTARRRSNEENDERATELQSCRAPSCRAAELPRCRATELPSCRAPEGRRGRAKGRHWPQGLHLRSQ